MLAYLIYLSVALLCLWAGRFLIRHFRRQLRGGCSCGGDCGRCSGSCRK